MPDDNNGMYIYSTESDERKVMDKIEPTIETVNQLEKPMNNVLECVARAIRVNVRAIHDSATGYCLRNVDNAAREVISALCDEIDESGVEAASHAIAIYYDPSGETTIQLPDYVPEATEAIKAYLQHLKSTTETKE